MNATSSESRTIVLIHGLFLNYESWDHWVERYAARGHRVIAAAWPGLDRTVAELRDDPEPLTHLTIERVLEHLEGIVDGLDAPIIIGHSFGGLFAQLLAYRGHGAAVVGLDATAPAGVLSLPLSTLRSSAPVLANPLNLNRATMLTPEQFRYAFANTLDAARSRALYDRYAVPCANHILFEGAFDNFIPNSPARIDVAADRPPILLVAGGEDHLVTPGYSRENYALIARSPAPTAFVEFPGRPHLTGGVPGWEAVADDVLAWALAPRAIAPGASANEAARAT